MMKEEYGFHVDVAKCTGCKTCQVACRSLKESETSKFYRRVYEYTGGHWQENNDKTWHQDVFAYYVSISCNHCQDPICVRVCPTTAMHKDAETGLVLVDHKKCIGCRYCEWACPYGAPQFDPEQGQMTKCDGCIDRLARGEQAMCVTACPLRALDFGPIAELREKYGSVDEIAPLPEKKHTRPHLVITGGRHARPALSKDGAVLNKKEF
ncbi:MAG: DMSO/selenate family reductase complex B subunit [Desulfomicrobium sp.]|jgi:anaerobic dimethyl sulfoxide reductase subunit B (iron-sulfur subunit)|nr:DMSO/selenate family reductase complex B subunit [Desulfomicrobium sp.]